MTWHYHNYNGEALPLSTNRYRAASVKVVTTSQTDRFTCSSVHSRN